MTKQRELIYGMHTVAAALQRDPSRLLEIQIAEGMNAQTRMRHILDTARDIGIAIHIRPRKSLDHLVKTGIHQGIIAWRIPASPFTENDLEVLLEDLTEAPLLLILDSVQDPHNLGACLRTADAAGVTAVVTPRDRAVGLTPVVRKVACGAAEAIPFIQVTNLARCLRKLKDRGICLVGADGQAEQELFSADLKGPLGLVMGTEGEGLRRLTRENCDYLIRIPMAGSVQSLNVSVATGICLFETVRQRHNLR
jgi:23S rRNA (guanosine2251-2'-O)-methyltransferase